MPFKENFVWGASTSSYQIEGAANADGKGESIWDIFCKKPGMIREGHTGAIACDHYHRYAEDVGLMREIGLKAYRFSLSWPRIMPNGFDGVVNEKGLDFYDRLIDQLLENGIDPYVTLYHWDMPQEVFVRGGWLNPESARWFEKYAQVVAKRFGDRVRNWITINEPQCAIILGLEDGTHAPGLQLPRAQVLQAGHHLLLAHGLAVTALREHAALKPSISIAPVGTVYYPVDETPNNIEAARAATFGNWADKQAWIASWFSDPVYLGHYPESGREWFGSDFPKITDEEMRIISQPLDVCSINFYQGHPIQAANTPSGWEKLPHPDGHPHTSFGWPLTPSAFYWLVKFHHERYQLPILITENGLSNTDWVDCDGAVNDPPRSDFLRRYLLQLKRAADDGIPLNGYFHWSLMDNFEWAEGYYPRFGLIHVDYQTQNRTLKHSAHF
jgi:beta-glucosidase